MSDSLVEIDGRYRIWDTQYQVEIEDFQFTTPNLEDVSDVTLELLEQLTGNEKLSAAWGPSVLFGNTVFHGVVARNAEVPQEVAEILEKDRLLTATH